VEAGDIAIVAGLSGVRVGDTIADLTAVALPPIEIEPPTMSIEIAVNDSPFAGQDGEFLTSRHLRERLFQEQETNAAGIFRKLLRRPGRKSPCATGMPISLTGVRKEHEFYYNFEQGSVG
jgi:hypothetical protein